MLAIGSSPTTVVALQIPAPNWYLLSSFCPIQNKPLTSGEHAGHDGPAVAQCFPEIWKTRAPGLPLQKGLWHVFKI